MSDRKKSSKSESKVDGSEAGNEPCEEVYSDECNASETASVASESPTAEEEQAEAELLDQDELERLRIEGLLSKLPPKFLAADPDFIDHSVNRMHPKKVLLPDGGGGVRSVDSNIVRIEHQGKMVELIALPPEQKRIKQRWLNVISFLMGVIFLILFFVWLNQ